MFTGIIKEIGVIKDAKQNRGGRKITIGCNLAKQVEVDQSININGVCHTAISVGDKIFTVQSVDETLRKTNIGSLKGGDKVNLEPSLHPQQLLDGHIVQGHADTTGTIEAIEEEDGDHLITVSFPSQFKDLIVGRGSIAIDGVSLTMAEAETDRFKVAIIPFTYEHTVLQFRRAGDSVNLEFDILGKYVARYLQNRS